jgi:hypothetical protein
VPSSPSKELIFLSTESANPSSTLSPSFEARCRFVKNNDRVGAVKFGDAAGAPAIVSDIERKAVLLNLLQILGKEKNGAINAGSRYEIDDASKSQISIKKQAKIYHGIVACHR